MRVAFHSTKISWASKVGADGYRRTLQEIRKLPLRSWTQDQEEKKQQLVFLKPRRIDRGYISFLHFYQRYQFKCTEISLWQMEKRFQLRDLIREELYLQGQTFVQPFPECIL